MKRYPFVVLILAAAVSGFLGGLVSNTTPKAQATSSPRTLHAKTLYVEQIHLKKGPGYGTMLINPALVS